MRKRRMRPLSFLVLFLFALFVWLPLGMLLTGTHQGDGGYYVTLSVMDVNTGALRELSPGAGFEGEAFIYTTKIAWVKPVNP